MEKVSGTIKNILYISDNFSIFRMIDIEDKERICIYNSNDIHQNDYIVVSGIFEINERYGERFRVSSLERRVLNDVRDIERYLSSSLFAGIGVKTARKIVDKFGEDTLDIIHNNVERIKEVDGIGEKKFIEIKSAIEGVNRDKGIISELIKIGFSLNQANKIYSLFHGNSIDIVKKDPYELIDKISGFGFRRADSIRERLSIPKDSPNRIKHGIFYVLRDSLKHGHTFILYNEMLSLCERLLGVDENSIIGIYSDVLSSGLILDKIFNYEDEQIRCVFLTNIYMAEYEICSSMIRLYIGYKSTLNIDIYNEIKGFEERNNFKFSEDQERAVICGIKNGLHIITGGPGTGKTTIIKFILNTLIKYGFKVIMVAPTGRAAKRMMETTGFEAKTIHRVLEIFNDGDDDYNFYYRNERNRIKCDVIIIDEASMVDVIIASKLFGALSIGTKVIIVGDVDQLPSIGPGNFLRDIIESGIFPVSYLNNIYRQKENSYIVLNAHRINNGEDLILNKKDSDFFILKSNNEDEICSILIELVTKRIPKFFQHKIDPLRDIQVLSPIRKGCLGVNNLNVILQDNMNPKDFNKSEITFCGKCFRVFDKVMQIKNNYEIIGYNSIDYKQVKGVFNGDIGYIVEVNQNDIKVMYDDNRVFKYTKENLSEIEHAYAITIHKSQGSEFPIIVIPIFKFSSILMNRNILYTAITRARKYVVLVGDINYLSYMVHNTSKITRYSSLRYLFNEVNNLLDNN